MNRETLDELRGLAAQLMEGIVALAAQPEPGPQLLTFEEAAARLAIGRTLMQELVDGGNIPVVEVTGRAPRVDVRDIEVFLKARRTRRG